MCPSQDENTTLLKVWKDTQPFELNPVCAGRAPMEGFREDPRVVPFTDGDFLPGTGTGTVSWGTDDPVGDTRCSTGRK